MNDFKYLKKIDFSNRRYIGASDVPTLALMNIRYGQTPLTLWEEKTGRREGFKGNSRTRAGNDLEPIILKWGLQILKEYDIDYDSFVSSRYQGKSKFFDLRSLTEARHPDRKYLVAHADLIDVGKPRIIEAKSTGFFGGKRREDINFGYDQDDMSANGIPSSVFLQIQTQMLVYNIPEAYVTVMIDTGLHKLYGPINAHKKTQEKILAIAERFWWHVENDKPPAPETWKDIIILNPELDRESKTVISGINEDKAIEMKARAKKLRAKQKEIKSEMDDIKNAIGLLIGENAYLENASGESLAKQIEIKKYYLKDYKNLSKQRFKKLIKDGFISETKYRDLRF